MNVTLRDLTKHYRRGVTALDHVTLSFATGMFGLLGPNGAGQQRQRAVSERAQVHQRASHRGRSRHATRPIAEAIASASTIRLSASIRPLAAGWNGAVLISASVWNRTCRA